VSRDSDHKTFVELRIVCRSGHLLGLIVRQRGRDMIGMPLERVDGPNGETKVRAVCATCAGAGVTNDSQMRWDRLAARLTELEKLYRAAPATASNVAVVQMP
jgi:hypothetical protein